MSHPDEAVSVVIPSRNRRQLLDDTVQSICEGDRLPGEILIIDQSDQPQSSPRWSAAPCAVRHLPTATRGLSRARNEGAAAARHPLMVFTDDDMRADRRWLGALVSALVSAGPTSVATGRVVAGQAEIAGGFVPSLVNRTEAAVYAGRLTRDVLAGGNMAIHRALFLQLAGFDERLGAGSSFPAAEDNDFGYRLLESGGRIVYVPEAVLCHRAWRPAADYLPLRHAYGFGKGAFYMKHVHRNDFHMVRRMVRDLAIRAARAPRRLRHPRLAVGEIAYALGVVRGALAWRSLHTGEPRAFRDVRP